MSIKDFLKEQNDTIQRGKPRSIMKNKWFKISYLLIFVLITSSIAISARVYSRRQESFEYVEEFVCNFTINSFKSAGEIIWNTECTPSSILIELGEIIGGARVHFSFLVIFSPSIHSVSIELQFFDQKTAKSQDLDSLYSYMVTSFPRSSTIATSHRDDYFIHIRIFDTITRNSANTPLNGTSGEINLSISIVEPSFIDKYGFLIFLFSVGYLITPNIINYINEAQWRKEKNRINIKRSGKSFYQNRKIINEEQKRKIGYFGEDKKF